jgi:hypothetical protein
VFAFCKITFFVTGQQEIRHRKRKKEKEKRVREKKND